MFVTSLPTGWAHDKLLSKYPRIMIGNAMILIKNKLNEYLREKNDLDRNKAILSNLINQDGSIAVKGHNHVVISVVNVEHETVMSTYNRYVPGGENKAGIVNPPVYINIYVLITSYFEGENYPEGLKYLSYVIAFFQTNNIFNQQTLPDLDPAIDKLTFELCSVDPSELSYILSMTGAKYLPSVYYKVRMFSFQDYAIQSEVSVVTQGDNPSRLKN
jgi:hypothetical protein